MNFLKKHYEKILLGVMLFGLIGVLVFMLFYIASDKQDMESKRESLTNPRVKALPNLDTTNEDGAILRIKAPFSLDFDSGNKLLNPMEWQRSLDGVMITAAKTGVNVAQVTNITPLYLTISFESTILNEVSTNYSIKVEQQAASQPSKRQPTRHIVTLNEKPNDVFSVVGVKGSPENPDALVLKLVSTGEQVSISKTQPYRNVEGYSADIRYPPENKLFRGRRVKDTIPLGRVDYTIVDIDQNQVTLMDESNQKKTSLTFTP